MPLLEDERVDVVDKDQLLNGEENSCSGIDSVAVKKMEASINRQSLQESLEKQSIKSDRSQHKTSNSFHATGRTKPSKKV